MSQPLIERANHAGRYSLTEIRAKIQKSKAFWESPEGQRIERERKPQSAPLRASFEHTFSILR